MPCKVIGWETLEMENIICDAKSVGVYALKSNLLAWHK